MMIVIHNARIMTMAQGSKGLEKQGSIVVDDGKIVHIGDHQAISLQPDTVMIDAQNRLLTPGLVEPHCHIGVMEEGIRFEGDDTNEMTHPIYPELRGLDSVYPGDSAFAYTYRNGITTVVTGPGSANVIGGTFTALKTVGKTVDDMVIKAEVCMKMALGENPKRVYSLQKKAPSTRMASAALIREWLKRAQLYKEAWDAFEHGVQKAQRPDFDMKLHSLKSVFEGLPVKIHAHRSDDIMTAIRLIKEFGLEATIEHATEAHLIAEAVKASGIPVILGPTLGSSSKYETLRRTFASGAVMEQYDIPFAIMTDHPVVTLETMLVQAALFVKAGLSRTTAWQALTIQAARLNGIDDRVGSLEVGKDADLVVWDGDPFDIMTQTALVLIDGQIVHQVRV